jgi:hypothetical protein
MLKCVSKAAWFVLLGVVTFAACTDEPRRGHAGESCTAANDCTDGLACIALVCVKDDGQAASGQTAAKSDGGQSDPSGSCSARRDCPTGSMCVTNACQPVMTGTSADARYSGRGESCEAKNDCDSDLSCVMGVCREAGLALPHLSKACYRVECANKDDCCQSFVPNANCDTYKANCATDPIFCNTYRSLCECSQDCVDELCVASEAGCMTDQECTSTQTPFCVSGKCRQCNQDSVCPGGNAKCADGVCMSPCTDDANCPLLYSCTDNACVQSGCSSDRECAFITKNAHAICKDTKCQAPCQSDADCASEKGATGFEICDQSECKFVGCDSDAECRALLNITSERGKIRAVCR